jgi:predicted nicotinamide N-methyase
VIGKADLILAADCVYFEPAFPLLVRTLCDLVADQKTEVLFCYKKRRKASATPLARFVDAHAPDVLG